MISIQLKDSFQMFEQKYIIMETIGHNSLKMTSIVKDKGNNYFIAKKVPINDEKTMHEIHMMKSLSHPNIIALHQIIEEEKWAYVIQEYCEEGDLQYHLRRQIKLKKLIQEEIIARWLLQILFAIEHLHHLKVIHRDIRPKNIFLTSNGNIKLGSFKVSKLLEEEANYAQTLINSPYYLTPQLTEGKGYDFKVDIWAFGCVLFEICSLKPPANLSNLAQLLLKVTKGKIDDLPYNYSKQLSNLYQQCMRRNPNERLTARQLLKTRYFLEVMQKFIVDKGLNINLQEKIPIKRYNIHISKYERLRIKKKLIKEKLPERKDRDRLLPRLEVQSNKIEKKVSAHKERSKQKKAIIQTPILKRTSKGKEQDKEIFEKCFSTQKKSDKASKKAAQKWQKPTSTTLNQDRYKKEGANQKQKKLMLAPPLLPKPLKKIQKQDSDRRAKTKLNEEEIPQNFEMTRSKQQLCKQLNTFQKKQMHQISEGLSKIFENLKIRVDDEEQIEFDFDDENQLRLTSKAQDEAAQLLNTCKSKLQQLIEEINYKYCPDMQRKLMLKQLFYKKRQNSTQASFQSSPLPFYTVDPNDDPAQTVQT